MAGRSAPKYCLVEAAMLPEIFLKVLEAKELLQTGEALTVGEAVNRVGISRSAFYKYKDSITAFQDLRSGRILTVSVLLRDQPGLLSRVLSVFARYGANILTINQSIPHAEQGVLRAQVLSPDTARGKADGPVGRHHLGAAAADVQKRSLLAAQGSRIGQPPLLLAGEQVDAQVGAGGFERVQQLLSVLSVPNGAGGIGVGSHPGDFSFVAELSAGRDRGLHGRSGQTAGLIEALAQPRGADLLASAGHKKSAVVISIQNGEADGVAADVQYSERRPHWPPPARESLSSSNMMVSSV